MQPLIDEVLARFGDRRFVRHVGFGPVPPVTRMHTGYFGPSRPPQDGVWLWLAAPLAVHRLTTEPFAPRQVAQTTLADWETNLVAGAIRDEACLHGVHPVIGWTLANQGIFGISAAPLRQRFSSPPAKWLRAQLRRVGKRWRFAVAKLRFLHPLQPVPVVVLRAAKPAVFAGNERVIFNSLHILGGAGYRFGIWKYEGFAVIVEDRRGTPFLISTTALRGTAEGSFWCDRQHVSTCPEETLPHTPKRH